MKAATQRLAIACRDHAARVGARLEEAHLVARTVAQNLSAIKDQGVGLDIGRHEIDGLLQIVLRQNPDLAAVFTCWEPNALDGLDEGFVAEAGHDNTGRFMPYWSLTANGDTQVRPLSQARKDFLEEVYAEVQASHKAHLGRPQAPGDSATDSLRCSISTPILANGTFYGIVGVDLRLDFIQQAADQTELRNGGGEVVFLADADIVLGATAAAGSSRGPAADLAGLAASDVEAMWSATSVDHPQGGYLTHKEPVYFVGVSKWMTVVRLPVEQVTAVAAGLAWRQLGLGAACLLPGLAIVWIIAGRVSKRVKATAAALQDISEGEGDLSTRLWIDRCDEVGELAKWFNIFVDKLQGLVQVMGSSAAKMEVASSEQAAGAMNQSTATSQMSTTTSELLVSAQKMAESGTNVSEQAGLATEECDGGTRAIQDAVQGIEGLRERVEKIAEHMLSLGGKSQQISGVLDIINELSEQTNLLSLNASIEAAGAGEAGKRFAVVASEIRKLAERAAESTNEIRGLIGSIQDTVDSTIIATEEGTTSVKQGVHLTREVQGSFDRIASQVASTARSAKAIEMASRQQTTAIEQLSGAVTNIDTAAQQAEKTACQMQAESQQLAEAAGRFKTADPQGQA